MRTTDSRGWPVPDGSDLRDVRQLAAAAAAADQDVGELLPQEQWSITRPYAVMSFSDTAPIVTNIVVDVFGFAPVVISNVEEFSGVLTLRNVAAGRTFYRIGGTFPFAGTANITRWRRMRLNTITRTDPSDNAPPVARVHWSFQRETNTGGERLWMDTVVEVIGTADVTMQVQHNEGVNLNQGGTAWMWAYMLREFDERV